MKTHCTQNSFLFPALNRRNLVAEMEQAQEQYRQSRVSGERRKSSVCGHVIAERRSGRPHVVRGNLLCSWRHGEPDQGTTVVSVRRPDKCGDDASQSIAVMVFVGGLYADVGVATAGIERHNVGQSPMSYDSFETVEARGAN